MKKENLLNKSGFRKILLFMIIALAVSFSSASNDARADEFGIISESRVYPDGLRLNTDSKLFVWFNLTLSDDTADKREGAKSLKGVVPDVNWFGCGIIWDPNNDKQADPKNMAAYRNGSLKFWVKTQIPLKVGIEDAGGTQKWVSLDQPPFNIPNDNKWRFVSIPIAAHFSGINFAKVTQLFMLVQSQLPAGSNRTFHLDNVRWDTAAVGPLRRIRVAPSSFKMAAGLPKSFIAKGYDAAGNPVDIYPAWTNSGISGSFIKSAGPIGIFVPSSRNGSGAITAAYLSYSDAAAVRVEDTAWNDSFNLFIERGTYGSIGTYDADDGNADGDGIENNAIILQGIPGPPKSIRAVYSVTPEGWAGLFFQEGELTDPVSERDLTDFAGGYLHFYVLTPADLEVSIRTNNIASGTVLSKVMLSDYAIPANNTIREVYIALDDFKIRDERLNLSRSKVFFNIAVAGAKTGIRSGTFYIADVKYLRRKEARAALSAVIKRRDNNAPEPTGRIGWSAAQLGGGWAIADQYLEVSYDTPHPSWGVQIYTDNMSAAAVPRYDKGDPAKVLSQQPAGLIGEENTLLTCPMAWMALDDTNPNIPVPVEKDNGKPENDPDRRIFFKSDTGGMWGAQEAQSEWSWLKDINSTKWRSDANGNGRPDRNEIVRDFSAVDVYSTFASPAGIATGWGDAGSGTRVYILNPTPPIVLYFAAKFRIARELQEYKTNTITLELYHY